MRKYSFILFVCFASILLAERPVPKRMHAQIESAAMKFWSEGEPTLIYSNSNSPSLRNYRSSSSVSIVLVDSSRNGYGMVTGNTTPLSYHPDNGFIMAYRQWIRDDPTVSGYVGAAFSETGERFETYSHLNFVEPAEVMGRYPSAVAGNDYPYIVWNEYTQTGSGGGENGGRPFYTWDQGYYDGGLFYNPVLDLNNGCSPSPCDPPDNWVGSVSLAHDGTMPVLNAAYSQWSYSQNESSGNRWLYHSKNNVLGYFTFDDPILLFDEADFMVGGFTSNVVIDINDIGVGYSVVSSYFKGQSPDSSHTLMIRKTNDYGESWSGEGGTGMDGTDYYFVPRDILKDRFFSDGLMISSFDTLIFDSPFISYEVEAKTDPSGGLHIFSTVIPSTDSGVYPGIDESCGIYHFYSTDPSDPDSWKVYFVNTTQVSFFWDNNWHRIYPSAAISKDNPNVMYVSYMAVADTTETYFNYDVFIQRSIDGGKTWESSVNVTDTRDRELDEVFPQLASVATNHEAFLMFESPDYNVQTVTPDPDPLTQADFKNRVYFAKVTLTPHIGEDPNSAPLATDNSVATNQNVDYSGRLSGTDADGDDLVFAIVTASVNGTVALSDTSSGDFIYSPNQDFFGADSFSFSVSDSSLLDTGKVNITVNQLSVEDADLLPDRIDLAQNYPNPFNPATVIEFTLPEKGEVSLVVYDLLGNKVATLQEELLDAGHHTVLWNGTNSSAGVYVYRLQVGGVTVTKKMILLK